MYIFEEKDELAVTQSLIEAVKKKIRIRRFLPSFQEEISLDVAQTSWIVSKLKNIKLSFLKFRLWISSYLAASSMGKFFFDIPERERKQKIMETLDQLNAYQASKPEEFLTFFEKW